MQYIKEAFSDANIELVHRTIFKQEDVCQVVRQMREEGKFSSDGDQSDD